MLAYQMDNIFSTEEIVQCTCCVKLNFADTQKNDCYQKRLSYLCAFRWNGSEKESINNESAEYCGIKKFKRWKTGNIIIFTLIF